jgi:hypothetical protein
MSLVPFFLIKQRGQQKMEEFVSCFIVFVHCREPVSERGLEEQGPMSEV